MMEEQVPPSQPPVNPQITPEQLEEMKVRARNLAIQQTLAQKQPISPPKPQVIYVRRNFNNCRSCCYFTFVLWFSYRSTVYLEYC